MPPSRWTSWRTRGRPIGALARSSVLAAVELPEAVEDEVEVLLGDADAGVGDRHGEPGVGPAQPERDAAARRELQGVREQVEHDALEHVDVDVGLVVELVAHDLELESRVLDGRAEVRSDPGDELLDVGPDPVRLDGPGLEPREVEDAVDEARESVGVAEDQLEALALLGVQPARRRGRPAPGRR